ncbi:unnamed protein product [Schistosoma curassoni]|uniref:DUF3794 domain-containing protein n=1 Tax=Schistosoma curassoni TaxID=6186 RepID=A0A183L2Z7_9TREM|nr:unnamed protein product [Schistosoma curassoni]
MIATDSVESYGCSDLNEIPNSCETTVPNQSTCQISRVIVPDFVFPSDSLISNETPCKSEENMLSKHNYVRKPDVVLMDVLTILCSPMPFLINLRKLSQKNQILMSYQILFCPHNAFVSCGKLVQCEAQVLNELDFDYNSDDFISIAVYPYHEVTSNVYSTQCEKYVLNEATSFINCEYKDLTLFRGGDILSLWFKF